MRNPRRTTARRSRRHARGQAMVEFALVILPFMVLFVAIAEFAFMFSSYLSISFASRDGVQVAAEMGNDGSADFVILQRIEQDISAPLDKTKITSVDIYWSDGAGNVKLGAINSWTRGGSTSFTLPSGTILTVPYQQTASSYPPANRCNVISAAGCAVNHTSIDTIGVKITYQYAWITPLPSLIGGSGSGMQMSQSNMMRLEPVL